MNTPDTRSQRVAAFFDMDRTLVSRNTGNLFAHFLWKKNLMSLKDAIRTVVWMFQYTVGLFDVEKVTRLALAMMKGQSEAFVRELSVEWFRDWVEPWVSPSAKARVANHRDRGDVIAILTASTPYATDPLAKHLGIDHVICTRLIVENGLFTGTYVEPLCYGPGKVHWAEAFARAQNVDLTRSVFYTDSFTDLPMLERIGTPRVVNPDPRLKREARRRGWQVERW